MSRPSPRYFGPLPNANMSKWVWTDQVNTQPRIHRPLVPDANINDRVMYGQYRTEYNPYFFDNYINRNIY